MVAGDGDSTTKSDNGSGKGLHAILSCSLAHVLQLLLTSACPRRPHHQLSHCSYLLIPHFVLSFFFGLFLVHFFQFFIQKCTAVGPHFFQFFIQKCTAVGPRGKNWTNSNCSRPFVVGLFCLRKSPRMAIFKNPPVICWDLAPLFSTKERPR